MESNNMTPNTTKPLTPLWVISLFVSLTEGVLGVAVTQTQGPIQTALTVFVVVFPLLIAGAFFSVLWNKPYVFYSPHEYGSDVNVRAYVEAMQKRRPDASELYENIQTTIRNTLASETIVNQLSETVSTRAQERLGDKVQEEVHRILASAADQAIATIREESFFTVDSRPLVGDDGEVWQIPYDRHQTASEFLDALWFSLEPYGVLPMTYGVAWVLRDSESGKILTSMGRKFATEMGMITDNRSLKNVGIVPGARLEAVPFRQQFVQFASDGTIHALTER